MIKTVKFGGETIDGIGTTEKISRKKIRMEKIEFSTVIFGNGSQLMT